jgi:hypothetical protein
MKRLVVALAALALFGGAPSAGQAQTVAQAERYMDEIAAWLAQVNAAIGVGNQSFETLASGMQALGPELGNPERFAEAATRIRALTAETRQKLRQADSMLVAIAPLSPATIRLARFDLNQVRADARAQTGRSLAVLDRIDEVADALQSGDPMQVRAAVPKLFEANSVLIDNQRLMLDSRSAMLPQTNSTRQALALFSLVYRLTSTADKAWVRSRIEHEPDKGEAMLLAELRSVAGETATLLTAGRSNLAREIREVDSELARNRNPRERALLERLKAVRVASQESFTVGDELRRLAETASLDPKTALVGENEAAIIAPLTAIEQRFMAINTAKVAAIQRAGQ